jgi:hypothetical protein
MSRSFAAPRAQGMGGVEMLEISLQITLGVFHAFLIPASYY